MKKEFNIKPTGLKGSEVNDRIKELMKLTAINENENKKPSVIELTKMGPDGNVYAIVRENHDYYIKSTAKKDNLLAEDFNYIGGLANKESESSYAKALKQLKLKFNSLSEAYNTGVNINVFENDHLVNENGVANFSEEKSNGFSGEGNLEGNKKMWGESDEKAVNNPWAICTASVGREDKAKFEACVKDVKKEKGIDESVEEPADESIMEEELTEVEQAVEDMNCENNEKVEKITESKKLSIMIAIENMDSIIDELSTGSKKKIYTIK